MKGIELWEGEDLHYCHEGIYDVDEGDYHCVTYVWNYEAVHVELLHGYPPVIAYRDIIPKRYINDFLKDVGQMETTNGSSSKLHGKEYKFGHKKTPAIAKVFNRLTSFIPFLNFKSSDPWQVLRFKRHEHYPPRHDYLDKKDALSKKLGNRFATFAITLKNADSGGETSFPLKANAFKVEPGDAMFWTDMETDREKQYSAAYGDCPVFEGEKVTAILRLRERGQLVLEYSPPGGFYNFGMLFSPSLEMLRSIREKAKK